MDPLTLEGCDRKFRMTKFPDIDPSIPDRSSRLRIIFEKVFLFLFERFRLFEGYTEFITELLTISPLISCKEDDLKTKFSKLLESLWSSLDDISMDRKCPIQIEHYCMNLHFSNSRNSILHIISLENTPTELLSSDPQISVHFERDRRPVPRYTNQT
jgi:hypothetical protein